MTDKDNLEEDYLNDLLNSLISEELGNNEEPAIQENEVNEEMDLLDHDVLNNLFEEPLDFDQKDQELSYLSDHIDVSDTAIEEVNDYVEPESKTDIITKIKQKLFSKTVKEKKQKPIKPLKEKKIKVKKTKAKKTKDKKPKEKKPKKIKEVNPEMNETIKLSFKGIILAITFMVVIFIIVSIGGEFFYNKRMKDQAIDYYASKQYKKAYNVISGLNDIEEDQLYQQLRVIMEVNKNYETYKNLKLMDREAEALDYLIRGIVDYDKNQEQALELGVIEDFNLILGLINKSLNEDYQLSESEAREISHILNEQEYSKKINSIVNN